MASKNIHAIGVLVDAKPESCCHHGLELDCFKSCRVQHESGKLIAFKAIANPTRDEEPSLGSDQVGKT